MKDMGSHIRINDVLPLLRQKLAFLSGKLMLNLSNKPLITVLILKFTFKLVYGFCIWD